MKIGTAAAAMAALTLCAGGCGGADKPPPREEPMEKAPVQRSDTTPLERPRADRDAGGGRARASEAHWTEVVIRDVSYPGVKRLNAVVLVPLGLPREQLSALLESVAREIAEREKARAVMLDAFRWEDEVREGSYSVGRVYYAPNGNWMDAAKDDPMAAKVELGTLYFREGLRYYDVSDEVALRGAGGAFVPLFRTLDTSRPDQVLAEFPDATPATVVGRSIKAFGGRTEHIRYRVRIDAGGLQATGWVEPGALRPAE